MRGSPILIASALVGLGTVALAGTFQPVPPRGGGGTPFTGGVVTHLTVDGGFTANGTATFNAPPPESVTYDSTNRALGKTCAESSTFTGTCASAFDGDTGSFQHTYGGTGEWLSVDLGAPTEIGRVTIVKRSGSYGDRPQFYKIQTADDSGFTTNVVDLATVDDATIGPTDSDFTPRYLRYLRILSTVDGQFLNIAEFRAFSPAAGWAETAIAANGQVSVSNNLNVTGRLNANGGAAITGNATATGSVNAGSVGVDGGPVVVTQNGLGATVSDGEVLQNLTAATAVITSQIAPVRRLRGSQYRGGAAENIDCYDQQYSSVGGLGISGIRTYCRMGTGSYTNVGDRFLFGSTAYWNLVGTMQVDQWVNSGNSAPGVPSGITGGTTGYFQIRDKSAILEIANTIADNGAGTAATLTLAPTTSYHAVTCNDANGCDVTLSETGAVNGLTFTLCNNSASNPVNILRIANQAELHGAAATQLHANDCIRVEYGNTTWRQVGRTAHNHAIWDDVQIVPSARTVGANAATLTEFRDGIYLYAFSGTAGVREIHYQTQLPHRYVSGTAIVPHVHFADNAASPSGNVVWQHSYSCANVGGDFPAATLQEATATAVSVQYRSVAVDFSSITCSACVPSTICVGRLFRDSGHASDSNTDDVHLVGFDFHVQVAGDGTSTQNGPN